MASISVTLTGVCAGGNHLTFSVVGGALSRTFVLNIDELDGGSTEEILQGFAVTIARLAKAGRTRAQARAILEAGVTVTV